MFGEEVEKSSDKFEIYSIDIAPANEKVIYSDFSNTNLFETKSEEKRTEEMTHPTLEFIENSFDQVSFLYLLSYMPDPILRFQESFIGELNVRTALRTDQSVMLTHIGKLSGNDLGDFPETFSKKNILLYCDVTTDDN